MALAERLKEAPPEVKDVFARARGALQGIAVTGEINDDQMDALANMLELRNELGWENEEDADYW